MRRSFFLLILLLGLGCAKHWQPHPEDWDSLSSEGQRKRIVENAEDFSKSREYRVGTRRFSHDCSGYIGAALLKSGIDVFEGASELDIRGNGVQILHQYITKYGSFDPQSAQPGDLVFFSNTYDRNRDGKLNDALTHVGVVDAVDDDGTLYFLHYIRGRVVRYSMNLDSPDVHENDDGKVINSYLRKKRRRDHLNTPYLTGGLFAGFGSLVRSGSGLSANDQRLTSQLQSSSTGPAQ